MTKSERDVANPSTTLDRLAEIASSLYYQDTGRFPAWDRLLRTRPSPDRDAALSRTVGSECHGRESQGYRRRAADMLLASPTATVDHLIRVVVCCSDELRDRAAKRVIEIGGLTDAQRQQMERWVPSLMGVEDTADASNMRAVRGVLLP